MFAGRLPGYAATLWAGVLAGVAFIGAPAGFATGARDAAGRAAGRMFAQEAYLSVVCAIVLFIVLRRIARDSAELAAGSLFSGDMLLAAGALFCTVFGYFALQPMMDPARAGQGPVSFGMLHLASTAFYAVKLLLVMVLGWRLSRR